MKINILRYGNYLFSTFWFVPALMVTAAIGLSIGTVILDGYAPGHWVQKQGWIFTGGAESASVILGTIAGSMITIAGVVFSMTLVALSLASSQFGPRLLRNFMRDKTTQVVLGMFVSMFLYCLLVLRSIRRQDPDGSQFVPHLSVTLGIVAAVVSLGVLIYFIHHVSASIQADTIIARVYDDLIKAIDRLFPQKLGQSLHEHEPDAELPTDFESGSALVAADDDGYVQSIEPDGLLKLAVKNDVIVKIVRGPGHYAVAGAPLARVWPSSRADDELTAGINKLFVRGPQRTGEQDAAYSADQLVEVAVRALSPGINDPFTAMTCIDRLGSALCKLARRDMPSGYRFDDEKRLRVIAFPVDFSTLLHAAFDSIGHYGRTNAAVANRLLTTIQSLASVVRRPEDQAALRRQADLIRAQSQNALPDEYDRTLVQRQYDEFVRVLP